MNALKNRRKQALGIAAALAAVATISSYAHSNQSRSGGDPGYDTVDLEETHLTPAEKAGREIWYKSTAGNARFHTYTLPQRIVGGQILWGQYLRTDEREHRFDNWGLINDPECCTPGSAGCPAKSLDETYGMDWCPGDDQLLKFVGRETVNGKKWRDPACDFKDPAGRGNKEDPCHLEFGTSTGALGFRKFPNPRFNAEAWKKVNGRMGSWTGIEKRPSDFSIEPPFRIGTTCGSCHISFNPANPPADPNHPKWQNILGTVGNQYMRNALIFGSGTEKNSMEWQMFRYERPGATDTSAFPNDSISNPGTINAIINLPKRPQFTENVKAWRKVASCARDASPLKCWCDPAHGGKCWEKTAQTEKVFHILKGGEDTIGAAGAVQRVYINIGSCAEECWLNHLTDIRVLDPTQRNYGQTPFDIGQCRRDCPNFRAIEDRVGDIFDFLASARPTDLHKAKRMSFERLVDELGGTEKFEKGKQVFANRCAQCHSSQSGPFDDVDFHAMDRKTGMREDWLGNDQLTAASAVETYSCRALHSNHSRGHVWEQYASEDFQSRAADPSGAIAAYAEQGAGHMRNISLLNAWAYAPFLHNNAVGPEICQNPSRKDYEIYSSPYSDSKHPKCVKLGAELVSVEGRLALYKASMQELLTDPARRPAKVSLTEMDIDFPLLPTANLFIRFPKGTDARLLGSFRLKEFAWDLIQFMTDKKAFREKTLLGVRHMEPAAADQLMSMMDKTVREQFSAKENLVRLFSKKARIIRVDPDRLAFYMKAYANCVPDSENGGHRFGTDLSQEEKDALIAFLATL